MVREARVEEGVGLGRAADLRRGSLGSLRDLSLSGRPGRARAKPASPGPTATTTPPIRAPGPVWVDDVDAVHRHCVEQGLEVTWPPSDEPWGIREMHVRHPDGHVFRISRRIEAKQGQP